MSQAVLPKAFIWRRLQSLMGLWLVLFLIEHLFVNSQAALLWGENGKGFVSLVNGIHNLPYLQVIEVSLLGVPILIHGIWGIKYLLTSKSNSSSSPGNTPSFPEYGRNRAFTWQRITSWILLVCIIGHVAKFRFIDYPDSVNVSGKVSYFVTLELDQGLYTVANRLQASLYDSAAVEKEAKLFDLQKGNEALVQAAEEINKNSKNFLESAKSVPFDEQNALILIAADQYKGKQAWIKALEKRPLKNHQVIAVTEDFGSASVLIVRDTFKNPIYVGLYTVFVIAACFHAFNGLWTFLITWGAILSYASQKRMLKVAIGLMFLIGFLGLISVWGTYWLNLKN